LDLEGHFGVPHILSKLQCTHKLPSIVPINYDKMFKNDLKILNAMLLMYETLEITNKEQLKEELNYQISRILITK